MVHLTIALPALFGMFAGAVKQQIEQQGKQVLGRLTHEPSGDK